MNEKLLEVSSATKRFGGLVAVNEVSLEITDGSIHALIGPNGSGKSTFLNLVSGIYPLDGGQIDLKGQRLNGLSPHHVARRGVGRTFQNIRLFRQLTVLENVMVGLHYQYDAGLLATILRTARARMLEREHRRRAEEALQFLGLEAVADWRATNLSYGQQRRVELARALLMQPRLLLLDEPDAGLNPTESVTLMKRIRSINERGITVLLVEHNMRLVMDISDRVTVLDFGQKIADGTPQEIQNNERVIEAYLGTPESDDVVEQFVGQS